MCVVKWVHCGSSFCTPASFIDIYPNPLLSHCFTLHIIFNSSNTMYQPPLSLSLLTYELVGDNTKKPFQNIKINWSVKEFIKWKVNYLFFFTWFLKSLNNTTLYYKVVGVFNLFVCVCVCFLNKYFDQLLDVVGMWAWFWKINYYLDYYYYN